VDISNNIMLRQTPKGIYGISIGYHGKKVKKHLVVFMVEKAHGLGFYQNTGHTLSSGIGVLGLYPTQQQLLM
jgi:L-2-hydroxyglutarate oxidase LhgO